MKNKKKIFLLFTIVILAQLFVPLHLIFNQEDIINTRTEFKFQTAPIDSYDAFKGKYITLYFKESQITVMNAKKYSSGVTIFATISATENGFAKVNFISKSKPENTNSYLQLKVGFSPDNDKIAINLPFDRFYMSENIASKAEKNYRESSNNKKNETYDLVGIKNGEVIIKDVRIDEVSIKDLANKK